MTWIEGMGTGKGDDAPNSWSAGAPAAATSSPPHRATPAGTQSGFFKGWPTTNAAAAAATSFHYRAGEESTWTPLFLQTFIFARHACARRCCSSPARAPLCGETPRRVERTRHLYKRHETAAPDPIWIGGAKTFLGTHHHQGRIYMNILFFVHKKYKILTIVLVVVMKYEYNYHGNSGGFRNFFWGPSFKCFQLNIVSNIQIILVCNIFNNFDKKPNHGTREVRTPLRQTATDGITTFWKARSGKS